MLIKYILITKFGMYNQWKGVRIPIFQKSTVNTNWLCYTFWTFVRSLAENFLHVKYLQHDICLLALIEIFMCACLSVWYVYSFDLFTSQSKSFGFKLGIRLATIYKKKPCIQKHKRSEVYMKTIVSHWRVDHTHARTHLFEYTDIHRHNRNTHK